MTIKFIKHWRRGIKVGEVRTLPDGMANLLIKRKVAQNHETPTTERAIDADPIPERPSPALGGKRGGNTGQRRKQTDLAASR
jgi:hypothetical protein